LGNITPGLLLRCILKVSDMLIICHHFKRVLQRNKQPL